MDDIKEYLSGGRSWTAKCTSLSEARRRAYEILTLGSSLSGGDQGADDKGKFARKKYGNLPRLHYAARRGNRTAFEIQRKKLRRL